MRLKNAIRNQEDCESEKYRFYKGLEKEIYSESW
jgi:hypothetical protein